jgi:tRNA (guanosine-2'-O-)-methyltransferase
MQAAIRDELIAYLRPLVNEQRQALMHKILDNRTRHLTVALEHTKHPHNASAVVRTCDCFGVQDLHVIEPKGDFELSKGISMGSNKWISIKRHLDTESGLKQLKAEGYQIVAMTLAPGSIPLRELDITKKTALFFGNEEVGLSETVHQQADKLVHIPMHGFTQSFNISVSAALALSALTEELHQSESTWHLTEEERLDLFADWLVKSTPRGKTVLEEFLKNK